MPVQKQTRAGQRTRFKAFVAIGDYNGHVGLGVKCSKEVATAIRGAIILAKLSIVPVRRGYWGNKIGKPHTVPCKVSNHWKMFVLSMLTDVMFLIGYRKLWKCWGKVDSCPKRNWHCQCSCTQEAFAHGWNWRLLHFCNWSNCHPWKLW